MIEQLFGSKTRVKLLELFYSNPNRSFFVREITRKVDEQINSVRRELANLLSIRIISSENNNNKLYYEVNQGYKYYQPLSAIFRGGLTAAVSEDDNAKRLRSLGHVELAIFTGQFTRDETSGVDILLVGDINHAQLEKYIEELEAKEGKQLRYTLMSKKEFLYRRQVNDRFLSLALSAKKQIIIDSFDIESDEEKTEGEQ